MTKPKAVASLSNLIDSEMEEDEHNSDRDALLTPESNQENSIPAPKERRPPGRPKAVATRNTRAQTNKGGIGKPAVTKKRGAPRKAATTQRTALKEQANNKHHNGVEETANTDERMEKELEGEEAAVSMDELVLKEQPKKRGKPAEKATEPQKPELPQQTMVAENDGEFEYTPTIARQSTLTKKATATTKPLVANRRNLSREPQHAPKIIPETQEEPMDLDVPTFLNDEDLEDDIPQSVFRRSSNKRSNSRQAQPFLARRRGGSASDAERVITGDPATRRKLGEITKELESLDTRYRNLREVGIKQAEVNFEKLKTESEAKANAANELIISLKKELATQKSIAQESRSLQKQLTASDAALSKSQQHAAELTTSLSEAQSEIKALQVKLANSRSASVAVESVHAKTPGSVIKGKGQPRTIMVGSAEAAQAAQVALLKEDLYSDLTGLILRGVERGEESDIYDCIQTGRNGTLHFHLAVANDTDAKVHYEDTTFLYTPRLDANRDRDLLELLPDYLSEEIAFSRVNAAMFYGRVVETLTKRRREDGRDG